MAETIANTLSEDVAFKLSQLPLKCLQREFPNKPDHVMDDESQVQAPRIQHPAFYGCYDWHSSVHGHWMLVRLLKMFRGLKNSHEIRSVININLSEANIKAEVIYLRQPHHKTFERTYGWAWLLKLSEELYSWDDPDGKRWKTNLQPLVDEIIALYLAFLPRQKYPIRVGTHTNTAFGLGFALDYARKANHVDLEKLVKEKSLSFFGNDHAYPLQLEPGGEDFFSPALMEASLMRRVMDPIAFRTWANVFFSKYDKHKLVAVLDPAVVTDRSDPRLVHLDGLNFSRAWCFREVATALPNTSRERKLFAQAADRHISAALPNIASGNYEGEHWLASFALYLLLTPLP